MLIMMPESLNSWRKKVGMSSFALLNCASLAKRLSMPSVRTTMVLNPVASLRSSRAIIIVRTMGDSFQGRSAGYSTRFMSGSSIVAAFQGVGF